MPHGYVGTEPHDEFGGFHGDSGDDFTYFSYKYPKLHNHGQFLSDYWECTTPTLCKRDRRPLDLDQMLASLQLMRHGDVETYIVNHEL